MLEPTQDTTSTCMCVQSLHGRMSMVLVMLQSCQPWLSHNPTSSWQGRRDWRASPSRPAGLEGETNP